MNIEVFFLCVFCLNNNPFVIVLLFDFMFYKAQGSIYTFHASK